MKLPLIFLGLLLIPLSSAQFIEQTSIISGSGDYEKTFDYQYNNYFIQIDSMKGNSYISYDYDTGASIRCLEFNETNTFLNSPFWW